MKMTHEKKEAVKNGILRMVLVLLSMVLALLTIFILILVAGSKATWIYLYIHILGLFLVLAIYSSPSTASIRMTWMFLIMALPLFGTMMYVLIGSNGQSIKMRKRFEDIDNILFPILPTGE